MSRWVEIDALELPYGYCEDASECYIALRSLPSIDIVRCTDCRHVEREDEPLIGMWCTRFGSNGMAVWDNCFCSFGERREEGEA